jgi:hypothetical protein
MPAYVVEFFGSNKGCSFWAWQELAVQVVHLTLVRSLPVSKRTVRFCGGVPTPMVTTYSRVWKGRPRQAGMVVVVLAQRGGSGTM